MDFGLLRKNSNFRRLYLSQLISMLGSQMTMITVPFQMYALTGSTFETGLVSAIELCCLVATALWGGVIADRFNRKRIIIGAELAMMATICLMAINASVSSPSIWVIYVLAGVSAALSGLHRPALEALTPQLVEKEDLPKVSSLISAKYVTATLVGPAIAGYLVAMTGPFFTYLVDASSFLISLLFLLQITVNLQEEIAASTHSLIKEIGEGARYIYSRKDILASYLVDFFAMVFCMPQVLFPAFANHYEMNEWLGVLYMACAAGGVLATLLSGWTIKVKNLGYAIALAAAGWSFSIFCTGILPFWHMLFIGFFAAGICDTYSGIFRMTMWNESISENYRGRIAGFAMLSYMSGPLLGNTVMGFLGETVGLHPALAIGGSISLLCIAAVFILLPQFRGYRSPAAA